MRGQMDVAIAPAQFASHVRLGGLGPRQQPRRLLGERILKLLTAKLRFRGGSREWANPARPWSLMKGDGNATAGDQRRHDLAGIGAVIDTTDRQQAVT